MTINHIRKYMLNCFILLIPIFLWNMILFSSLPAAFAPETFWKDIPPTIGTTENVLRIVAFSLPAFMPLTIKDRRQKVGLALYLAGVTIYFLSWVMQVAFPESAWSLSLLGFTAPAFSTLIWFVGLGLIGDSLFVKVPFRSMVYITISALFVLFHTMHAYIVYTRL